MTTSRAPLTRIRLLAAAIESTTGTPASLSGSNAAFKIFNHEMARDIWFTERQGQGASMSPIPGVTGAQAVGYKFETEFVGKGATGTPPILDTFLCACGWTGSGGTYTPNTTNVQTLTMALQRDLSRNMVMAGCMGNAKMTFKAGEVPRIAWDFKGAYVAPTSVGIYTPTYPATNGPRFASATITIGGATYLFSEMTIDLGNKVVLRRTGTTGSGYLAAYITERKITVTVDPEAQAYSTQDWNAFYVAGSTAALSASFGTVANNTFAITGPALQLEKPPEDGDRDGILTDKLSFQATRNTGDDELQIVAS